MKHMSGLLFILAMLGATQAQAATTLYSTQAAWESALVAGSIGTTETFETFAAGANLRGVDLGGYSLDTNALDLSVFQSVSIGQLAFLSPRQRLTEATYFINFNTAVSAFAFDVAGWNPASPGPATLNVELGDGSVFIMHPQKTTGIEEDPYFVGLTSIGHQGIKRISWSESPEIDNTCCEEVGLDNLRIAVAAVPEPETYAMMLAGLGLLGFSTRKRQSLS